MKRFNFPLERVRKWRQDQADLEELRLQQLCRELRGLVAARIKITSEADQSRRAVMAQSSVTAEELSFLEAFREYAREQVRKLKGKEAGVEARISEQRLRVMEAHRRFQVLEAVRDKALIDWRIAVNKEQEELAAELYLARLKRKTPGGGTP